MEMETDLVLNIDDIEEEDILETRTYYIDFENGRIDGMVDGLSAVQQAITKILMTERFKNIIYSDDYGSELKVLLMNPDKTDALMETEIPELIKDALLIDDRILEVSNFNLDQNGNELSILFDVYTIYGDMSMEVVV